MTQAGAARYLLIRFAKACCYYDKSCLLLLDTGLCSFH